MRSFAVISTLALVVCAAPACSDPPTDVAASEDALSAASGILIKNGVLVDPATRTATVGSILIDGGKIKAVAPAGSSTKLKAGTVIDAAGKYVMPGLADLHTHLFFGNSSPHGFDDKPSQDVATQTQLGNRYLYAGVTTYLDLFAPNDAGDDPSQTLGADLNIFSIRAKERGGDLAHPRSFVAGPLFVVPGSHGIENFATGDVIQIKVNDEAGNPPPPDRLEVLARTVAARVEKLIQDKHPDVVKFIYDNHEDTPANRPVAMPLPIAKAIIGAANAHKVKTVAHVGSWKGVEDLANAGVSAFTHLPSDAAPPSVTEALRRNNVAAITTMSIYSDYGDMDVKTKREGFVDDLNASTLAPDGLEAAYRDFAGYTEDEKAWVTWGHKHNTTDSQGQALRSLIRGRVRILAGTDSGNAGALYGFSVARELMQFESAGMPIWDVLRAATSDAQEFLGEKRGALAAGFDADLVILDADPVARAANLRQVSGVILKGKVVDRAKLDR